MQISNIKEEEGNHDDNVGAEYSRLILAKPLLWTQHKDVKLHTQPAVSLLEFHLLTFTRDDQKSMGAKQKILPHAVNNVSSHSTWILTTLQTSDNQMQINRTTKMLMVKYNQQIKYILLFTFFLGHMNSIDTKNQPSFQLIF